MLRSKELATNADIESIIINHVSTNPQVPVTKLIPELSKTIKGNRVRNAYWKLLSENRIRRSPAGKLSLPI